MNNGGNVIDEETHFGNLGLGNALAVAYDIYGDNNVSSVVYNQSQIPGVTSADYAMTSTQYSYDDVQRQNMFQQSVINQNAQARSSLQTPNQYIISPANQAQIQGTNSDAIHAHEAYSYLNPIPTSLANVNNIPNSLVSSYNLNIAQYNQLNNNSNFLAYTAVSGPETNSFTPPPVQYSSNDSPVGFQVPMTANTLYGPSSTSSSCVSPTSNNSLENNYMNNSNNVNQNVASNVMINSNASTNAVTKIRSNTNGRSNNCNAGASSTSSSDEGVYEISEEEIQEIDESLSNNPEVIKSRHWKYYVETNEWTRATCALMACLFSREQMANSTVLGRGGAQRERLPTNLVAYVVTKIRRRFNRPAAAVRARMAQKCKDERRFGRNPANGEAKKIMNGDQQIGSKRGHGGANNGGSKRPTAKLTPASVTVEVTAASNTINLSPSINAQTNLPQANGFHSSNQAQLITSNGANIIFTTGATTPNGQLIQSMAAPGAQSCQVYGHAMGNVVYGQPDPASAQLTQQPSPTAPLSQTQVPHQHVYMGDTNPADTVGNPQAAGQNVMIIPAAVIQSAPQSGQVATCQSTTSGSVMTASSVVVPGQGHTSAMYAVPQLSPTQQPVVMNASGGASNGTHPQSTTPNSFTG